MINKNTKNLRQCLIILFCAALGLTLAAEPAEKLSLDECLRIAKNKHFRKEIGKAQRLAAEAKYRQAMSAYWPQLSLRAAAIRLSDDPNFVIGSSDLASSAFGAMLNSLSASGAGAQAGASMNPLAGLSDLEVKLLDRDLMSLDLELKWLLLDGGGRSAMGKAAQSYKRLASIVELSNELDALHDVQRYYAGALTARDLINIGSALLERFEVTLELTEKLYKGGSMSVKKTDYLRNKVLVVAARAGLEELKLNYELACSALGHSMGFSWDEKIEPADMKLKQAEIPAELNGLIADAYDYNPNWLKVEAALDSYEASLQSKKSEGLPRLALTGNIRRADNEFSSGLATDENLENWRVGLVLEVPLFTGFLQKGKVAEAKAALAELKAKKLELKEGLGIKLKTNFLTLHSMSGRKAYLNEAFNASTENRDLSERAYRDDLIEADTMFESLMLEAFMQAQLKRLEYDLFLTALNVDHIVATEIQEVLEN